MTRRTWLETTEYSLVLMSLVGTLMAAVSQQVVLAALPLSLALLVNLIHRNQLEASQQQLLLSALESLNQRYGTDIKFLRRRLQDALLLPEQVNLTPLEQSLQELQHALGNLYQEMNQRLATVEGVDLQPLQGKLTQLQEQYILLRAGLGELTQNLAGLPQAEQVAQMGKGLAQVQRQAAQLQTQVQQLRQTPVVDIQPLEAQLQYLSQNLTAPLHSQIATIEAATQRLQSAVERLGQDVAVSLQVGETVSRLERELHSQTRLAPLVQKLQQDLAQVVSQYQQHQKTTQNLSEELRQLQTQQAQVASWEPRLSQLEQQNQTVQELHNRVNELQEQTQTQVSRAALLPLVTAVERLHQQQTQQQDRLAPLSDTIATVQTALAELQNAPEPAALKQVRSTLAQLTHQMGELTQGQTQELQQVKQELSRLNDLPHLQQQLTEIAQLVSQIDHSHGDLRESTQTLARRQSQTEQQWQTLQTQLQQVPDQVTTAIQDWANTINDQLRQLPNHRYELVADRFGGREVLQQALTQTHQELVIVTPWLSQQTIDRPFLQALRQLLTQGVQVSIGWGDVQDLKTQELCRNKRHQWREGPGRFSWKYNALGDLEQLEQEFPHHLHLKIIGTHEHYLISDDQFALVGSHALLGGVGNSREVSLKTNDPHLIQDLRKRFQRAANLDDMNW